MLEGDEDAIGGGFGYNAQYRADINDPSLSNAGQTHALFEFLQTFNSYSSQPAAENYKLAKSILNSEGLPNEFLGLSPLQLVKKIKDNSSSWE
jgi:hypothetical protein